MIVPNLEELVSEVEQSCVGPYIRWLRATWVRLATLSVENMTLHVVWYWFNTTMPNDAAPIHVDLWRDVQFELSLLPHKNGYYSRQNVLRAIDNLLYVVGETP